MSGIDLLRPNAKLSRRLLREAISGSRLRVRGGRDMRISQAGTGGIEAIAASRGRKPNRPVTFMAQVLSHTADHRIHFAEVYKPEAGYDAHVPWPPGRKSADIGAAYILPRTAPLPPIGEPVRLHEITLADGSTKECWLYVPGAGKFKVVITGYAYAPWPEKYTWACGKLMGASWSADLAMPDWSSPGMSWAYNGVEMLPGFGTTYGPGGFLLEDEKSIAVPLRIPIGQPVDITIETDSLDGSVRPVFSFINGVEITCKPAPGAPGAPGMGMPRNGASDRLRRSAPPCSGCG